MFKVSLKVEKQIYSKSWIKLNHIIINYCLDLNLFLVIKVNFFKDTLNICLILGNSPVD